MSLRIRARNRGVDVTDEGRLEVNLARRRGRHWYRLHWVGYHLAYVHHFCEATTLSHLTGG